ncbi:MAG: cyclic pyranopterin monophosphate synthase MoaC [Candidatus Latescibacteria bacterium]|nr:cyclic pyranopterin monophosphate synthase MoaC [Candidatus Latescibacterota bacterium]
MELSHLNRDGSARMVDVTKKAETNRRARARGRITFSSDESWEALKQGQMKKGDVLTVAKLGGIGAAKSTGALIPLCHPLSLTGIELTFSLDDQEKTVLIESEVHCTGKTGVEMEALTAVAVAALTIYDMCKAVDKGMIISDIRLIEKAGGKSIMNNEQ